MWQKFGDFGVLSVWRHHTAEDLERRRCTQVVLQIASNFSDIENLVNIWLMNLEYLGVDRANMTC